MVEVEIFLLSKNSCCQRLKTKIVIVEISIINFLHNMNDNHWLLRAVQVKISMYRIFALMISNKETI